MLQILSYSSVEQQQPIATKFQKDTNIGCTSDIAKFQKTNEQNIKSSMITTPEIYMKKVKKFHIILIEFRILLRIKR